MNIPENKYLGTLCSRGHDFEGTGKSLRRKLYNQCVECQKRWHEIRKAKRKALARKIIKKLEREFNISPLHTLGWLCKHGHEFKNTGKSLRNKKHHNCVVCNYLSTKKRDKTKYCIKKRIKRYQKLKNNDEFKAKAKRQYERGANGLEDSYVKRLIVIQCGVKQEHVSPVLIIVKRELLKLKREMRNM